MSVAVNPSYQFGDFTVDTDQRVLLRSGEPVPLTPKVFDTLLILIENSGRIVKKEELMDRIWPDSHVEEANLTFNIQQLRKQLGDNARQPQYIETMARRGYRFIADVEDPEIAFAARRAIASDLPRMNKKVISAMIVLVLVLSAAGAILWKYSHGPNQKLGDFLAALPLKIEKLTATGESPHAAISSDGKYLAYTRGFANNQSIWLRQLATNTNVQIVPANGPIFGLAFAHSGEYLYFVKGSPGALYRVSLLGDVPIKIVNALEGKFSLSPNDHQVAFVRQSHDPDGRLEFALMIANSDGTAERTLLSRKYPDELDAPAWSPDSESIICVHGNTASGSQGISLVEVRVSDGTTRELSAERFADIYEIVWLPRQSGLLMSAVKKAGDYRQLWRVSYPAMVFTQITSGSTTYSDLDVTTNADRIVATQTTRASDIWVAQTGDPQHLKSITAAMDNFCWTPNRRLVYSSMASGNQDLWTMQPDGAEQKQLTVNAGKNGTPAVTPDNRYIVFMSNRSGDFQVWRMNIDGSNQVQLTNGRGKNFPALSSNGKWVLYNTTDNWDLWRVSIDGGEPTRLTERVAYFPAVSPDGKMIACLGKTESGSAILILPFEGGQPLKTFQLAGQNFSGTSIQWTSDGQALVYARFRDGVTTLIKQPLNGGRVEEITKFEDELYDFGYSLDGQMLAVTRGGWQHDVVLISDLNLR